MISPIQQWIDGAAEGSIWESSHLKTQVPQIFKRPIGASAGANLFQHSLKISSHDLDRTYTIYSLREVEPKILDHDWPVYFGSGQYSKMVFQREGNTTLTSDRLDAMTQDLASLFLSKGHKIGQHEIPTAAEAQEGISLASSGGKLLVACLARWDELEAAGELWRLFQSLGLNMTYRNTVLLAASTQPDQANLRGVLEQALHGTIG